MRERKKIHEQQNDATKRNFVSLFNWELISAVLDSVDTEFIPQARGHLANAFAGMLRDFDFPIPPELNSVTPPKTDALAIISNWSKENFDAIGGKLLERGLTTVLLNFGDALAALEKLPAY